MIAFHRLLIATAIVFCLVMAAWGFVSWRAGGGASPLALAVGFGGGALLLAYYLRHLRRFLYE
jgi:hypothetical protein